MKATDTENVFAGSLLGHPLPKLLWSGEVAEEVRAEAVEIEVNPRMWQVIFRECDPDQRSCTHHLERGESRASPQAAETSGLKPLAPGPTVSGEMPGVRTASLGSSRLSWMASNHE